MSFGLKLKRLWATHQKSKGHSVPKSVLHYDPLSCFLPLSEFVSSFDFGPKLNLRALISLLFVAFLPLFLKMQSGIHVWREQWNRALLLGQILIAPQNICLSGNLEMQN